MESSGKPAPTLGDRIIRWGVIAGGLSAIIGLGVLAWGIVNKDPTPTLDARMERLAIESNVTFGDFKGQQQLAAAPRRLTVALVRTTGVEATPAPALAQESPTATPGESPSAEPTVTPDVTAEPSATVDPVQGAVEVQRSSNPGEIVLSPATSGNADATVELPSGCRYVGDQQEISCDQSNSLTWALRGAQAPPAPGEPPAGDQAVVSAKEFLDVLRETRLRTVTRDGRQFTEPLGVTVSFEAVVEGYRGKRVDIRWSLHRTSSGQASTRDWLVNRRVLSRRLKADVQRISADFWVPIPRRRASSFIRVSLYDAQRERIAHGDTKRFR
jgi:hypothetical protein